MYIQSIHDDHVISAGDKEKDSLIVVSRKLSPDLNQLWILRAPDDDTNAHFVLMSAKTGFVMDVKAASTSPGTYLQISTRHNKNNHQFYFYR